jgi:hypothetical protein
MMIVVAVTAETFIPAAATVVGDGGGEDRLVFPNPD